MTGAVLNDIRYSKVKMAFAALCSGFMSAFLAIDSDVEFSTTTFFAVFFAAAAAAVTIKALGDDHALSWDANGVKVSTLYRSATVPWSNISTFEISEIKQNYLVFFSFSVVSFFKNQDSRRKLFACI